MDVGQGLTGTRELAAGRGSALPPMTLTVLKVQLTDESCACSVTNAVKKMNAVKSNALRFFIIFKLK